jgi:hypothetical protein
MRRKLFLLGASLFTLGLSLTMNSCKDDLPTDLTLSTLKVGTIDLNGATSPTDVPVNPTITAVFSTDIDQTTATSANITLTQDYDDANISLNITVSGNTITIVPASDLGNGSLYKLSFSAALKATNGKLLTALDRSFTTEGTFVPAGQIAYWSFENSANDIVGDYSPSTSDVIDITYTASRNTEAGQAATFNGTTSLIEIPNGDVIMNTADFTLCFWVNADSTKHGQFVLGLAGWYGFQFEIGSDYSSCKLAAQYDYGDGTSGSEDLWFPANGNLGWQGWTYCKDLTSSGGLIELLGSTWAQIICVYNSTTKVGTMYINGEKMKSQDFNLWPEGDAKLGVVGLKFAGNTDGNKLALGFIQGRTNPKITDDWANYSITTNNHFKGQLDDVRFFHKVLTETEIQLMYNSEKP